MTSRLDRLFVLLETGSSPVTRRAAATQLGEVQRLHPHELHRLLTRISSFLKSQTWETRIAAGQAVEAVLKNVPQWNPPGYIVKQEGTAAVPTSSVSQSGRLTYDNFDMNKIISRTVHLMGSEGKEYDTQDDNTICDREKLARQRQLLNARLGLNVPGSVGAETSELFTAEDFQIHAPAPQSNSVQPKVNITDLVIDGRLSSREINRVRRKLRQAVSKQRSREMLSSASADLDDDDEVPEKKRTKFESNIKSEDNTTNSDDGLLSEAVPDNTGAWPPDTVDWPLEAFCDMLCFLLFNPVWETRHGAATALRELIRLHGKGAGKCGDMVKEQMEESHQLYLEDVSLRLLCVLALDRFGDFVSDQVVAPVRETCAQALGSVLNLMSKDRVHKVLAVLLQFLNNPEWEARHGGLLGLKYLLAVRDDMVPQLLPSALPAILTGLSDPVDDVGAVAASSLIPVASVLVSHFQDQVPVIVSVLWDLLADQDELAAACNSFMGLLAALLSLPKTQEIINPDQSVVVRLWPFVTHSTSSVRKATLQTLRTLTGMKGPSSQWGAELLQEALRHIIQRALVEPIKETQDLVEQVWNNLVTHSSLDALLIAACPYVSSWLCLTMQPTKVPFDSMLLIHSKSSPKENKLRRSRAFAPLDSNIAAKSELKLYIGGSETTPVAVREQNVVRSRCMAARMLGRLSCYLVKPAPGVVYTADIESPIDCYVKVLLVYLNSKSALQRLVVGLVIAEWARIESPQPCPQALSTRLNACLTECVYFDEIAVSFTRLLQDTKDFIAMLKHYKLPFDQDSYGKVLTLDQIQQLSGPLSQNLLANHKLKPKVAESLEERRKAIQGAVSQTSSDQQFLTISTQAVLVGAVLMLRCLPEKLNPVVKPLMESVKREENEILQELAARHLAYLVEMCVDRVPCPNPKIVANLCTFLRSDPEFTPRIFPQEKRTNGDSGVESAGSSRTSTPFGCGSHDNYSGILTLLNQQKDAERAAFKRSNSTGGRGPGRPPITDIPLDELFAAEDDTKT